METVYGIIQAMRTVYIPKRPLTLVHEPRSEGRITDPKAHARIRVPGHGSEGPATDPRVRARI